ncbi:hypothetical protein BJ875DRAFT_127994 [Amylocarpus encephaloides]|uniref:Ataxin-10 homolog n=1 Tax=Amylocarpus encephaloides TaxID=45428 RepID=A0A9P7YCM9_9HELO|nr:hypothetical protein BJ875DRAFT_127994 [Amylocarpus encephaloides]
MHCTECDHQLPNVRDSSTICQNCKTPVATWWDETSQTFRTNRETLLPYSPTSSGAGSGVWGEGMEGRVNNQTIEERTFCGALIMLEAHFQKTRGVGHKTMGEVKKMIAQALNRSLNNADVREHLAKNVDIWMRLQKIFRVAIPHLNQRSLRESYSENGVSNGLDVPESAALILKNYDILREDLHYLNNLLVISRNMLAIKETAQDLCAAVSFDKAVHQIIILCVNVTSKGYDGENVTNEDRARLLEITELYKKLLVTCLQHTHNWTMGNDRFKMTFWFVMLFDNDLRNDSIQDIPSDGLDVGKVHEEVENWLFRHGEIDSKTAELLDKYDADVPSGYTAGPLPDNPTLGDRNPVEESTIPVWRTDVSDKYEQDRLYARVSHEIDVWWKRVRDSNYDGWVVPMETVEEAITRVETCKENAMHRYIPREQEHDHQFDHDENYDQLQDEGQSMQGETDERSLQEDNGEEDDGEEEEEEEDDDSYVEGPLRGLLTEIPNILDTKQIEALHMTVKACIVDSMGSGLTPAGENLQKTRCKMFLALDCGKNLLREMLVFIAVWEQNDQQFIFQITAQIIESFHHNALLNYAWNSLRIVKDIVSPAQTVLLRLINYMFRARKDSPIYDDLKDYNRDAKLIHFLYNYFRCRVVPDCIALIWAQAQIRQQGHPSDFPVDLWDMERAKDGLSQYLDFLSVIAEINEMRHLLIEWECVFELVTLLKALEAGVARKPIDERTVPGPSRRPRGVQLPDEQGGPNIPLHDLGEQSPPRPRANLPPMHDTPHKFPWSGIKIQILIILTSLIAPANPRRNGPGNPIVQRQLLDRGGIMPLLNCCVYDGHNEYLKERATLAIKFVMEGSEEAQKFVRDLVPVKQAQAQAQARAQAPKASPAPGTASTPWNGEANMAAQVAAEAAAAELARKVASARLEASLDEARRATEYQKEERAVSGAPEASQTQAQAQKPLQTKSNGSGSGGGKGKGKSRK